MSDRGKWNPAACLCSWESTVRGGRLCHYCAAIRQAQQGVCGFQSDQQAMQGLRRDNDAMRNMMAELQNSRRDQELAGMQEVAAMESDDTIRVYRRSWGSGEWSRVPGGATVADTGHPVTTDECVKPLPCKWCGKEPFRHKSGLYSCDGAFTCRAAYRPCANLKEWNRFNTPSRLAGAVTRFFNRWKLRAKYCCSLPWRGVKKMARYMFRDDSNGKAKHKLNDERLWVKET